MRLMAQGLFQQDWPQLHSFPKAILFPLHLRRGSGARLTRGCTRLLENSRAHVEKHPQQWFLSPFRENTRSEHRTSPLHSHLRGHSRAPQQLCTCHSTTDSAQALTMAAGGTIMQPVCTFCLSFQEVLFLLACNKFIVAMLKCTNRNISHLS